MLANNFNKGVWRILLLNSHLCQSVCMKQCITMQWNWSYSMLFCSFYLLYIMLIYLYMCASVGIYSSHYITMSNAWFGFGYTSRCSRLQWCFILIFDYFVTLKWREYLTHWGRVTHICVGNLTIIGSDNGLSPGRRQAIIWTNAGILLIGPLRTNFSEVQIGIKTFSFKKMRLKVSSVNGAHFVSASMC